MVLPETSAFSLLGLFWIFVFLFFFLAFFPNGQVNPASVVNTNTESDDLNSKPGQI